MQNTMYELTQTRHGLMLANPQDFYIGQALMQFGEYSHAEWLLLEQIIHALPPGSLALEVGANCGAHTLPMAQALAQQGSTLMAFEPQPIVFQQMCANLALNSISNVLAYPSPVMTKASPCVLICPTTASWATLAT